jgi:hypothetical protein
VGGYRAELLASSDGGRTFVVRGNIAVPPINESYPEPDVVELPDGSLYSVFRHHSGPSLSPLLWARSTDAGVTWSKPAPILLPFDGAPPATRVGINPRLMLLPNGVLVLSSGRNDNFVAVSTEPDRVEWRDAKVTYVNHPTATTAGYGPDILRVHGSSGNTGLESLETNRALQFGDNCANGWGCPAADSGHTVDNRNRVWRRFIEVVTPDVGKIDLLSKLQRGLIHVATDMTWSSPAHPRARVDGAFDGSTEYWSSAVKQGGKGELTIQLDRTYELTRIGLSIRRGERASASVYTSLDGVTFCPAPIVNAADRTHRAMEYFSLARPVLAAYVKVVTEASASCEAELGASCSFLNELELYSTVDSFENDPVGSPPRGYTDTSGVSVVMRTEGETRRVLRLTDVSDASIARAVWRSTPAEKKTLELSLRPLALSSAFLFSLSGTDAAGGVVDAFRFGVFPDGSVAHYDAGAKAWVPLVKAGSVPVGRWSRLRVDATLEKFTLLIDGSVVATAPPSTQGAVALDAHAFASGGTKPSGDDALIDDVYFR